MLARRLQLMEMRGHVRRGYFIEGLSGAQFASSEAVERLRECSSSLAEDDEVVVVNACDPLATVLRMDSQRQNSGISTKPARIPANYCCLYRGQLALVAE